MKSLIFVFSSSSFPNGSSNPIRRYDPERSLSFDESWAVPSGSAVTLEPGIYGVFSVEENVRPPIHNTGTELAVGAPYAVIEYAGKDGWPVPPATEVVAFYEEGSMARFQTFVDAIRARMADELKQPIDDEKLNAFLAGRGSSLAAHLADAS